MHHVHVRLYGPVQGVGFRHHVRLSAEEHGVHGRVRNRVDGAVEVDAEGTREALERFLEDVTEPRRPAVIQKTEVSWSEGPSRYDAFAIDPTA
jgi:acylphosphatase